MRKYGRFFSPLDEFCNFCDTAGSVLHSQHYIHPWAKLCSLICSNILKTVVTRLNGGHNLPPTPSLNRVNLSAKKL